MLLFTDAFKELSICPAEAVIKQKDSHLGEKTQEEIQTLNNIQSAAKVTYQPIKENFCLFLPSC